MDNFHRCWRPTDLNQQFRGSRWPVGAVRVGGLRRGRSTSSLEKDGKGPAPHSEEGRESTSSFLRTAGGKQAASRLSAAVAASHGLEEMQYGPPSICAVCASASSSTPPPGTPSPSL
uniref:Uncharacterized protein n=1 Tax=Amphiprion ocellaris TaxID=80972 RepID=A0AAQ5XH02_AMPOC